MPKNYYDEMYHSPQEAVAQDEGLAGPWTHRYTLYVNGPSASFLEELKAKDGVVAVYVKEKEAAQPPSN